MLISVTFDTAARVGMLYIALGYNLMFEINLRKYDIPISAAACFYFISGTINFAVQEVKQNHLMLTLTDVIMTTPYFLANVLFVFWTALAFKRTLNYLTQKKA